MPPAACSGRQPDQEALAVGQPSAQPHRYRHSGEHEKARQGAQREEGRPGHTFATNASHASRATTAINSRNSTNAKNATNAENAGQANNAANLGGLPASAYSSATALHHKVVTLSAGQTGVVLVQQRAVSETADCTTTGAPQITGSVNQATAPNGDSIDGQVLEEVDYPAAGQCTFVAFGVSG